MPTIANVNVEVTGTTSALDRDLARAKSHVDNFDRSATAATKRVAAGMTAMFASVRLLAGATGLLALGAAAAKAVQEFAEAEKEMLTLQAVIKATGGAAGRGADEINAMAESIANASLNTDNAVRQAAAQLLTFRSVATDVFDRAMHSSADLAAVGFGSVQSAAVALGIALENPTEGLSRLTRVGVTFTGAQKEVIRTLMETGRAAEAQRIILKAIEDQVGGAAAAQAGGLTGSFHRLKEATANWLELIGGRIAEITNLNKHLQDLAAAANDASKSMAPRTLADQLKAAETEISRTRAEFHKLVDMIERYQIKIYELQNMGVPAPLLAPLKQTLETMNQQLDKLKALALDSYIAKVGIETEKANAGYTVLVNKWEKQKEDAAKVTGELKRQLELLQMPELQRQQTEATRKAGVYQTKSTEETNINALVAQIYGYNQSIENAKAGLESFLSMSEGQRTLLQDMSFAWMTHADVVEQANRKMQAANFETAERKRRLDLITQQGNLRFEQQTLQVAGTAARVLTELFPKQKNAAIAAAVINTAVGVTEALKLMFPLNWIQAGLVAASGAAQIAAIRSTSLGGSGGLPSVSGGGSAGGAASAAPQAPEQAENVQAINFDIRGADVFSGNMLAELLERINVMVKDGHVLISTKVDR